MIPGVGLLLLALQGGAPVGPVPELDARGAHAEIAALFERARRDVFAAPRDAGAWWKLGALFDAHHLFPQAEACYRSAHGLAPEEFRYAYLLAVAADRAGRGAEETVPLFVAAARARPEFAPVHMHLGHALTREGRDAEAEAALRRALALDGQLYVAHRSLGQLLLARGDAAGARAHLEVALAAAPDDRATNASLARAYALLGERALAEHCAELTRAQRPALSYRDEVLEEVVELAVSTRARFERARRWLEVDELDRAVAELEQLLRLHPDHAGAHALLGDALRRRGDLAGAAEHLARSVAGDPRNGSARFELARLLLARARTDAELGEVAGHLRTLLTATPGDREARELLAVALARRGRHEAAVREFARAAEGDRELAVASFAHWAGALSSLGRPAEAAACLENAVMFHPEAALLRFDLGLALERAGRAEEAAASYRRAIELGTDRPAAERLAALARGSRR